MMNDQMGNLIFEAVVQIFISYSLRLHIHGYHDNFLPVSEFHNDQPFSTHDHDNVLLLVTMVTKGFIFQATCP